MSNFKIYFIIHLTTCMHISWDKITYFYTDYYCQFFIYLLSHFYMNWTIYIYTYSVLMNTVSKM
jgi:hypothetical protein